MAAHLGGEGFFVKLTNMTIVGVDCEAHVTDSGSFSIQAADDSGRKWSSWQPTLESAKNAAAAEIRKHRVKVDVRFLNIKGEEVAATGIHATNKTVLAREAGAAIQIQQYNRPYCYFAVDTPLDKLEEYRDQQVRIANLEKAASAFEKEWQVNPYTLVEAAVSAAVDLRHETEGAEADE